MSNLSSKGPSRPPGMTDRQEFLIGVIFTAVLSLFAFGFGAAVGWFVLAGFAEMAGEAMGIDFVKENPRMVAALVLGLALGLSSLTKQVKRFRRQQQRRELGESLGFEHVSDLNNSLSDAIEELYGDSSMTSLSNVLHRDFGSTDVVIGDLTVHHKRHDTSDHAGNNSTTQTVAYIREEGLRFPEFGMQPEGFMTRLLEGLSGMQDIDFSTHVEFSNKYLLNGTHPARIRRFFDSSLLDFFTQETDWRIRAAGDHLLIFRPGKTYSKEQEQNFIDETMGIFSRLRERATTLADEPPSAEETASESAEEAAAQLTGVGGALIRSSMITPSQVAQMVNESPPRRRLPPGLKRAKFGFPIAGIVGFMFTLGGGIFAGVAVATPEHVAEGEHWFFILLGGVFLVVGLPMLVGSILYRRYWSRLLKHGLVASGEVLEVKRTDTVINNQRRYLIRTAYYADGREYTRPIAVYGTGAKHCQRHLEEKQKVHVLYVPGKPETATIAEGLINTRPDFT